MKKLFLILALLSMVAVGCAEGGFGDKIDAPENIFFGLDKEFVAIAPDGSLSSVYCKAITPPTAEYQNDMFSGNMPLVARFMFLCSQFKHTRTHHIRVTMLMILAAMTSKKWK